MPDRDILVAIFNVLGALAERTTGQALVVCLKDGEGNLHYSRPDSSMVEWITPVAATSEDSPVSPSMHCPLCG